MCFRSGCMCAFVPFSNLHEFLCRALPTDMRVDYVCMCVHIYKHMYIYVYMYMYFDVCILKYVFCVYVCMCVRVCMCVYVCVCVCLCVCEKVYVYFCVKE